MKKTYIKPSMDIVEIECDNTLLTASTRFTINDEADPLADDENVG